MRDHGRMHDDRIHKKPDAESAPPEASRNRRVPTTGVVLGDGTLLELVYDEPSNTTRLVCADRGGSCSLADSAPHPDGRRYVPYSPNNNLIRHRAVLLPSAPAEYDTVEALYEEVVAYLHRYIDLSPDFEDVAACYVLLTWVHDGFNELPYLRVRGDYGSGKTRFLLVVGSVCYKPFFASGASTVSPIFHTLDAFGGTLVLDEADFRFSDERAEVVKVLNNGNVRGIPVLRTEMTPRQEFNPRAFSVFGPKVVASRGEYQDRALESRFLTERMGGRHPRADIPINLPDAQAAEALALRNKLLLFRIRMRTRYSVDSTPSTADLEPRMQQIVRPLLAVAPHGPAQAAIANAARALQSDLVGDRTEAVEADVLAVIRDLLETDAAGGIAIRDIVKRYRERADQPRPELITPRWIGTIVRKRLGLATRKSHGVYRLDPTELAKIGYLCERYGLAIQPRQPSSKGGDLGDFGDVEKVSAPSFPNDTPPMR